MDLNTTTPATVIVPHVTETITIPASQEKEAARPVSSAERIKTVDIVRGVALLGILLMNIPGFGIDQSSFFTMARGPRNTTDYHTLQVVFTFFEGTMRGLFSMLFGAGMILFTLNKKDVPGGPTVAELYYRRLLFLIAFGLFNAYVLLWEGDILYFYGFCGLALYPFRKTSAKWLFLLGILCIGINMMKSQFSYNDLRDTRAKYLVAVQAEKQGRKLTPEQQQAKAQWEQRANYKPKQEDINENVTAMRGSYSTVFGHLLPRNAGFESFFLYHGIWDMLCMMFIGMALLSIGFFSNKLSTSAYVMGLVVGYGLGIPISWAVFNGQMLWMNNIAAHVDRYSVSLNTLYDVRRVLLSLGHASLVLLIFRAGIVNWLMKSLSAVGQMAFTNYLMQSIICSLFFFGYGLGNYNKLAFHQLYYVVGAVWLFQMIASPIWLKYYRFGPFEWAWRSLTYWKRQPMKL
jgi:uncharacterized protein